MEESNEQQRSLCALFPKALNAYKRQSWEEAIEIFDESTKIHREDGPSIFYLGLCEKYRKNPPTKVWNGLVRLSEK